LIFLTNRLIASVVPLERPVSCHPKQLGLPRPDGLRQAGQLAHIGGAAVGVEVLEPLSGQVDVGRCADLRGSS
jgi:hypothetical protein